MSDNLKKVYSTLQREGYELPKYEEFEADMRDDKLLGEVRQTLVNAGYTPPEFNDFKFDMWGTTPAPADKSQYTFTSEQLGLEPEEDDMRSMTVERQTSMPTPMWGTSVGENRREPVKDLGSASSGQGGISEYIEMLSGEKSEGQKKAEEQMRIAKERAARGERNWYPYGDTKKPLIESPDIRIGAADNVGLGSPSFNAEIYADEAVRRAEEGLKPADAWTEATNRAQANIANKNRQAQIKKAAEDAVGELRIKSNELSRRYEEADAKRPKIAVGNPTTFGGVLTEQGYYDRDYRNLNAANNILKKTEDMMADFASKQENGRLYNLGRSMATSTFNPDNWDFGFGDANVAERLLSVVEKADKDEKLSESEQLLLDAAINQQVMQGYYSELSGWQKAGKMFGESLPFMAQIAVNPLGSMSKYAGSKAAKAVLKHISKKVSKKAIEKILARTAGLTAQISGNLGTSYGMALTSNLGNTTADALNRQIGNIQYDFDDNGVARYNGRLNVKEAGEAWLDAANNQAFEFYSEQMGNYFAPILKGMGKLGGKALKNFGMEGVNRWVSDFAKKGSVRQLNQFFDKTQFHGFASEYAEEIANGMLNAAFVGDMTMEDVFSKDNLIDTAIGLSVMGAIGPMVGTAGYARAKYKEKQALNAADEEGRRLMGHAWDYFADAVRRSKNGEELSANLRETLNSFGRKALPGEDMRQILSYAQAYNRYKAVEEVSAKAVAEGVMDERDLELQRQYEKGQTTTDKHGLRVTFEAAADAVEGIIPLNIGENTAYDIADEYDEQGDADTATAIRVFLSARAAHSGMTAQIREQAQSELESANAEIDSHTNKTDGNIYSVTLGGGLKGYVTGGTVITDSDGDIDIDATREANESGYVYVNVDGVIKSTSVDKFVSLDGVESAADAKAAREAEINAALNAQYEELTAPVAQEATPASTEVAPDSAAPAETAAVPVNNAPTVSEVAENAARALGVLPEELEEVILDEQEGLERAARYNNIGDTDSADAIRAYVAERFGTPAVQPAQVNNDTAAEVGNNGADKREQSTSSLDAMSSESNLGEANGAENIPAEQAPEAPVLSPEQQRKAKRAEIAARIPTKGKTKLWTQAKAEDVAEYIATLTDDAAVQQATADKYIADIKEKQAKMDAIDALELNDDIAFWERVKGLLALVETQAEEGATAQAPEVIPAPTAENEMQPVAEVTEQPLSVGSEKVSEPVGNSEQLNQSGDNTEMGAEGDAPGQSGVYSLSELRDNEGNRFYQKNGSIDLWDLSPLFEQARRQNAPIRLTERNVNHILDEHKKELGDSEESVLKFLDDVFSTARILRKARSAGIFVVVENTKTDKAAIIRLYPSKHGDYYNVESAGYYRKNKWKDTENVIAELSEPTQSVTASDVSKPQVPEEGGRELLNAETATTSADESTTQSANSQENSVKSGENTQNEGEISQGIEDNSTTGGESSSSEIPNNSTISQESEQVSDQVGKNLSWEEMSAQERMNYASKNPLTIDEIKNSTSDEVNKSNAIAYISGTENLITQLSYLKVYEDVRIRPTDSPSDNGDRNETQLAETNSGESANRGTGGESGNIPLSVSETGSGKAPSIANVGENSEGGSDSLSGERGDSDVRAEESSMDGIPAGNNNSAGSRRGGRNGSNGRRTGRRNSSENIARGGEITPQSNAELIDDELNNALSSFKDTLSEFVKAGKDTLSISLTGLNGKQLEILPKLISEGTKIGYILVKKGLNKLAQWSKAMKSYIGQPLSNAGLSDAEVDAFIDELWNSRFPIGDEVHTISEWASIIGMEETRKAVRASITDKKAAQDAAESVNVKIADAENITETLPFLLPQQQDDVLKAETQFFDRSHNDREHAFGKGYMFTNGTGTGKTYTGLGIVKRFIKQGKGRILIVTPSQQKVTDWISDAKNLNISLRSLDEFAKQNGATATQTAGEGAVITTYANFRENAALLEGAFDLVVYDESHRLLENKTGTETRGVQQHYMITNRDEDAAFMRLREISPIYKKIREAQEKFISIYEKEIENKSQKNVPRLHTPLSEEYRTNFPKLYKAKEAYNKAEQAWGKEELKLREQAKKDAAVTKVVFLSATPFNTRDNLDYAERYIFMYPKENTETIGSYRHQSPKTRFYLEHFGGAYKFRYGRLENAPQNADVIARQEVAFSDYLQNTLNTMSGRVIDSEYDYSRDFPTVSLEMGPRINSAIDSITEIEELRPLWSARNKVWRDYNYSSALFETMKVSAMLPRLKQHLEKGRKIVIFHRRTDTKEPIIPPFKLMMSIAEKELKETQKEDERKKLASAIRKFKKDYADLFEWEQMLNYSMPREQLAEAFGKDNVLFFSGKESAKVKNEAVKQFNDDNSGKNIIVIQEASGKEGISLHDRTGEHQRVVITLALPQSPITALQIEGRIYRIGNKSNAIFEYPILGLNSEIVLFGQNFNNSVSTTENLALGSKARSLRSSFARGIEERSGDISVDEQGIGGKEADANTVTENDPFENAVLDYYTNQKITTRRDSREGIDYYPTPEPLGFMMNIWGRVKDSDDILEPSAGHGAIARYVPMENALTAVEPSQSLFARLQIKAGGAAGRSFVNDVFENYNIINKHDVILMNPPFGVQGKLASEHVAKAYKHLNEGGRIVAIVPEGKAQSRIEKWLGEQKDAVVVGEVLLPDVTFVQAGTSIRCRVLVIDKISNEAKRNNAATQKITHNLGYVESIDEFFDTLRNINMPDRTIDTQLIMEKKVRRYAGDLRGIKGVKEVYVNPESVVVRTKGWRNFNIVWGDLSGNALKKSLAQQYSQFAKKIPYADETSQEVMKELQGIICKLANMTEDEMERFIANPMQDDDTLYRENDDIRFRSVGGNSGYVGYSMSKRAAEAREEGRFPKTDFKREYDMPQQTLDALVEAGIIDNSEWHHTSKIGNRTTFYGWTDKAFADIYAENKKEIDAMVKDVNANIAELEKEEKDFLDSWKGYQYPESFDWNAYRRRAHEVEDLPYNERMDILRSEFPETAEKEKHDSRQQEFSREIDNRKREQRKRINELFTKNVNYIVSLFNRENAGAAPCVVIKSIDTLEAQLKELGFSDESIKGSMESFKEGCLAEYNPNEDYVVIYDSNASENKIIGYLWHENAHKEIGKVYTQEEIDNAFNFYFKNNIDKVYESLENYPKSLVPEEALIRAFEEDYQHALDVIDGNDTETREKRMSFIEFFRPIVNNIRYGERENTTGEQQGAKSVRPDNVGELEVRNSETQRETERREERIQKVNSEIISAVNKLAAELHTDVEIVKEVSAIPDARKRGSKGWYDGRVHLVLPNATSVDDAVATILHEVVGHKGLRALFGEGFNDMLADVFKNAPKQIRKAILDRALNMMAEGRKDFLHVATEEYLAEQAERGFDDYSFLDKAKGWILKLLRSIGLKSKISDSEIRYMLWRNYNLLKSNNALAEIENIAMQARLGVGEYRARGEVIDANHRDTSNAQEQYNKNVEGFTDRVKEAWIDKTRSVKKMQEAIEKETGNKIADYANVYLLMNQMPGRVREKMDKFLKKHLDPLGEFLKEMFKNDYLKGSEEQKQKQVERYLNCKHGIERNIDMSVRAALTNEEGVLDRKTYEQYTTEKEAIWEKNLPWAEEVKELTELSKKYNAKEKDYSGLTALFPGEDSYKKIRSKAIKRVEDFENAFDKKVIDELWKRVGDINELTLKESYKSGLLSNDLYRSIKRQYKYYVPLRGFEETTADEVYEYLSREDVPISGPIRRAEGRKSEAEKIFATMANMYNSAVSMGAKNRIKQALFQMAVMNKTSLLSVNPSYYKEDGRGGYEPFLPSITDNMSEDEIREEMEKYEEDVKKGLKDGTIKRHREGLNIDYKSEKWQRDEHAVRVKRNGTEFVVFVNGSPRVAQAVNGLLDKRGGKFIQTLQAANRWRARNITGYNVNFTLSNLARDIQEATITAFAKEGFAYAWKFEKELTKNLAAFRAEDGVKYRGIHNLYYRYFKDELDLTDKREKYFKEFMENGGETGFHSMMSIEDYQKRIKKAVDSNLLNATGKGFAAINDTVEFVNRGIENACRFATYVASRESGKSIMQSVNDAKEASVNFNRVGSGAMGNLYFRASKMFLNPAIQGLVKRLTLMRDYPARMVPIVAMELLTGYIVGDLAMMAMKFIWDALGFDDDDEENNAYYNLSDFVRRSNVIIPLVDGKFMKIPLSHESRVAHGIGEMISSYMNGHLDYENIPAQLYAVLTQSIPLNPTAPDSFTDENLLEDIAKVLIPDAFALPAYEALALNRDFTGRRITGRSDYNEHRPEYMRAGKGTPEFFIEMSRTINDWTGGSDIERGVLENAVGGVNNPTFYEYMLIANLGGIATMTAQLYKTAQAMKGDEEYQETRNYPIINRFFEDTSSYEEKAQERTRRDYERAYRFFKEKVKDYSDVLNNYKAAENMGIDGLEDELEDIKGEKMEEKRDAFKPYKQDLDELYDELNEAKDKKDRSKIKEIEKDILEKKIEAVKEMEKEFSWE